MDTNKHRYGKEHRAMLRAPVSLVIAIVATILLAAVFAASASILDAKTIRVDFTNFVAASSNAVWADTNKLIVTSAGLGFDGDVAEVRDCRIKTKPLAVGMTWRTPRGANVSLKVAPAPKEITLPNGQKMTPFAGRAFVRYSPDLKHWSSWQELEIKPSTAHNTNESITAFSGRIGIPSSDSEQYNALLQEYARLDVPWQSDEQAAVKWILQRQPDFFEKQIPFIGYVEFMQEGMLYGGQRIRSLEASVFYGIGGLHSPPKDKNDKRYTEFGPWNFKAKD